MTNDVNLGIGLASGMAFIAPAGTALPTYPGEALGSEWSEISTISDGGITWTPNKDSEPIRNWAKITERLASGDEGGLVKGEFLRTIASTLEAIFGEDNVETTAATSEHGNLMKVKVEAGVSSTPKAFLFLMKDNDDMIMLGTEVGMLRDLDDLTFVANDPIKYGFTIEAAAWTLMKDDGQKAS